MKNNNEIINVAFCVDNNYSKLLDVVLYSIYKNNKDCQINAYIVHTSISDDNINRLIDFSNKLENITLYFKNPGKDNVINNISVASNRLPIETYFRFLLPEIIDEDKVIYLDTDILVVGSLLDLWHKQVPNYIAGAHDFFMKLYKADRIRNIGVEPDNYINAGIMVMDLKSMREDKLTEKLINLAIEKADDLEYGDQDIINMFLKKDMAILSEKYNYIMDYLIEDKKVSDDIVILHFAGVQDPKPWKNLVDLPDYPMDAINLYREYRKEMLDLVYPKDNKVSIIVNINNQNNHYLLRCIDSIVMQSYSNKEIVLVDSLVKNEEIDNIVDKFQEHDIRKIRIDDKLLWQKEGVFESKGGVVIFINSLDFFIHNDYLDNLYKEMEMNKCDIVIPNFLRLIEKVGEYHFHHNISDDTKLMTNEECITRQKYNDFSNVAFRVLWGNLIKRSLFETIGDTLYKYNDQFIMFELLNRAKKILFTPYTSYCFLEKDNKLCPNYSEKRFYKQEEQITIIVNVNDKTHLVECINSIKNQNYKNIEVIIVRDEEDIVLDSSDDRITIINVKDLLLGFNIKSSYVLFMDSDELLVESFIENIYAEMINTDSEIGFSNVFEYNEYDDTFYFFTGDSYGDVHTYKGRELTNDIKEQSLSFKMFNGKIIKLSILNKLNRFGDVDKLYKESENIVFINDSLYMYRVKK